MNTTLLCRRSRPLFALTMLGLFLLLAALLPSASQATVTPPVVPAETVVVVWDKATLQAIRDTHPGPSIVARALAVVHTCIYDAWAAYDGVAVGTRTGSTLRRPAAERTDASKSKALSFAAYRALRDLFPQPAEATLFRDTMTGLGYDPDDTSTDPTTPAGIGNLSAQAVLDFRHTDGSNQLGDLHPGPYTDYSSYQPVNTPTQINDPNRWQPLRVSNGMGGTVDQKYITPFWGRVTPFSLSSGSQFRPTQAPALYGSARYKQQALQILHYSALLTDNQKVIAEYWADGPASELPPGHWALFAQYVSARDSHMIDQDVKMFFAVTNAIFDASIVAWDAKLFYDSVRPVTAIHYLFAGQQVLAYAGAYQGTKLIDGKDWQPYQAATVVTPPFPEYISGHSIFSRAGAEVLRLFTGSDTFGASVTIAAGSSRVEHGTVPAQDVTLTWPTFTSAADEAGISRRYGGIHFVDGDIISRHLGVVVADQAYARATAFFNGTAH